MYNIIRQFVCFVCFAAILSVAACGAIDLPSITDFVTPTGEAVQGFASPTAQPNLRTLLPEDMTATAAATQAIAPQGVVTATPDPNAPAAVVVEVPTESVETEPEVEPVSAEPTPLPPPPTPEPTATPIPDPLSVTLRTPLAGSQFIAGTGIDVSGSAAGVVPGQLIRVALINEQGGQLTDATLVASAGDWRVILPAPNDVSGMLTVRAQIVTSDGSVQAEATTPIEAIGNITLSEIPEDDYFISIDRVSDQVFAGRALFLNGRSGSPLDAYDVTIEIYYQDCATGAGPISFQMFGSGAWNGYLIVPGGTQGSTICARAYTGTPGTDSYRQSERKFVVLDPASAESRSVEIAAPRPGSFYTAPFDVTGVAINPPLGYVLVQALTADGTVLWEQTTVPDGFGNWTVTVELNVQSPFSLSLAAIVDNTDGTFTTDKHAINVQPLDTGD